MEGDRRIRVAVNGFGRIGLCVVRGLFERREFENFELVAVNAPDWTPDDFAHHLAFDTAQGRFSGECGNFAPFVSEGGKKVAVLREKNNGYKPIKFLLLNNRDPRKLPWDELNIDIVLECTGAFRTREKCQPHLDAGAKRVIVSAPPKGGVVDRMVVFGVNHGIIKVEDLVVSASSCTTNAAAQVLDALRAHEHKIVACMLDAVHAVTDDQKLVDGRHSKSTRSRAAMHNISPTDTGAAKALVQIFDALDGNCFAGSSVRVPVLTGSLVNLVLLLEKPVQRSKLVDQISAYCSGNASHVAGTVDIPGASSSMFVHDARASIIDLQQLVVTGDGRMVRIAAWYDNEWGYACQMLRVARHVSELMLAAEAA